MARTTTNLALKVWNLLADHFNHSDLADNWDKIDAHNHTGGGLGVQLPAGALSSSSVSNSNLTATAVNSNVIVDGAVNTNKLADQAVTQNKVADALAVLLGVSSGAATRSGYAQVLTDQTTSTGGGPIDMATPGPSVTVSVPANGLIMLRAEVTILGTLTNGGYVFVQEDSGTPWLILSTPAGEVIPRATLAGSTVGTNLLKLASWHVFTTSAGTHTYKMLYSGTGTLNTGEHFKDRKLWIRTIGF